MVDRVGQQFGNYRLIRLVGRGGFAEVYLGEHIYLGTQAAIKVLHTQLTQGAVKRFNLEARTVAHLEHPNIVRVLDYGVENTTPFLVMSYAAHSSLRDLHQKGTRVPLTNIIMYVKQVAAALQYAHDSQLIHRDIKPENMLLGNNNEVLLSDFGLVLVARSSVSQTTQEMAGTVPYTAPEQLQGRARKASDQYSLGIVVYEWLCGECPFNGPALAIATQHLLDSPPSLRAKNPMIPQAVEEVVLIALAKDPRKRFGSVRAFSTALEQACKGELADSPGLAGVTPSEEALVPNGMSHSLHDQSASIFWTQRVTDSSTISQDQEVNTSGERPEESDSTPIGILLNSVFQFNEQLTDPGQFFGRARERETVLNRSSKRASTSIVGPRRIGKTWLMSYLRLVASTMLGPRCRIGYLDATLASCATVAGFTARALEELDFAHLIPDSTHVGLATLERVIQDMKSNNQIALLCIDEFEGLGKRQEFTLDFFIGLRAMTQIGLSLVVASRSPLIDIVGDNGETSGFFNVFEQLTLEPFSLEEARAFVRAKAVQAEFNDQEQDLLLRHGQVGKDQWPPIRLQLVGKMLLEDKTLARKEGLHYYRPNDLSYWQKFEQRLEEKYRGVVR
jgi:serine/threonine protein kinase